MRTLIADGHVDIVDILSAPRHDDHPGDGGLAAIVLDDPAVLREIDGRIRQDLLTDALVAHERDDPEQPSLLPRLARSEEHTSELQSLMRISYAVFCLKKKKN